MTVFTQAVDLEGVPRGGVVMFATDLLFQPVDLRRKEFHRTAALRTHHVMMAAAVVLMLITGDAVVKSHFARQSTL